MSTLAALRPQLRQLLIGAVAGLGTKSVAFNKLDTVESYPFGAIYIKNVSNERDSKDGRIRGADIALQIWQTSSTDIEAALIATGENIENELHRADLVADCYVSNFEYLYPADSRQQGAILLTVTASFTDTLTIS